MSYGVLSLGFFVSGVIVGVVSRKWLPATLPGVILCFSLGIIFGLIEVLN